MGGFDCGLKNYGMMRDTIGNFTYEFNSGIYILKGECTTGGWALSMILTGHTEYSGDIYFNEIKLECKDVKRYGCYVGEDSGFRKYIGKPRTVKEQIEYGISKNLSYSNNIQEIKDKFGLSEERFNRPFKYLSGERWRASMAIGYANGKTIYCFPWVKSKFIYQLEDTLKLCLNTLLEVDAIIIIPTTFEDSIRRITQDYKVIELS